MYLGNHDDFEQGACIACLDTVHLAHPQNGELVGADFSLLLKSLKLSGDCRAPTPRLIIRPFHTVIFATESTMAEISESEHKSCFITRFYRRLPLPMLTPSLITADYRT